MFGLPKSLVQSPKRVFHGTTQRGKRLTLLPAQSLALDWPFKKNAPFFFPLLLASKHFSRDPSLCLFSQQVTLWWQFLILFCALPSSSSLVVLCRCTPHGSLGLLVILLPLCPLILLILYPCLKYSLLPSPLDIALEDHSVSIPVVC